MRPNYAINSKHKNDVNNIIKGIIFSEFDVNIGPVLKYQYPKNCISQEIFESLSVYLIPKLELHGKLITITAFGLKILGYPVSINDIKYKRNQLIFNISFVFTDFARSTQYEPIIKKLAHYLIDLEGEMEFISKRSDDYDFLFYLSQIKEQLNREGVCVIPISLSTTIHLKLAKVQPEPETVRDHHVPVIISPEFVKNNIFFWDLTTQQIYQFINGFNHVAKIAFEADVDLNLVKACVQNLIYYGLVTLIPIFQYSNVYVTTPKICNLVKNHLLQKDCITYVKKSDSQFTPSLRQILHLYSNMCPGMTVKDLCQRFNPNLNGIDEQKLIKFGLMKGIIRRIQKYPILLSHSLSFQKSPIKNLNAYFDGNHSYDQISCDLNKSYFELEDKIEKNPSIVVCWK